MHKTVLITGATSGFGEACAIKFAANNYRIIINGRRNDRLQALKEKLEKEYGVQVLALPFDVRNQQAVFDSIAAMEKEWQDIDVLINNAGLALGRDFFEEADLEDWNTMIDTNLKGLLYVSKAIVPFFISKQAGHIINIGSIAGVEVYEKGNVYCASKHAVDALSRGMRIDLLRHRIKVTAVHPGAAETEFSLVRFKGDSESAKKIYEGYQPLSANDIADTVFYVTSLPAHVCINELQISCVQQASAYHFSKD